MDPTLYADSLCSHQVLDATTWQPVRFSGSPASDTSAALKIQPHTQHPSNIEILVTSITAEWLASSQLMMISEEFLDGSAETFQGTSIRVLYPEKDQIAHGPVEFLAFRDRTALSEERLISPCRTRCLVAQGVTDVLVLELPSLKTLHTFRSPFGQDMQAAGPRDHWHHAAWISFMAGDHIAVAWVGNEDGNEDGKQQNARRPHRVIVHNAAGVIMWSVPMSHDYVGKAARYSASEQRFGMAWSDRHETVIVPDQRPGCLPGVAPATACMSWSADGRFLTLAPRFSSGSALSDQSSRAMYDMEQVPYPCIDWAGHVLWSNHGTFLYSPQNQVIKACKARKIWRLGRPSSVSLFTSMRMMLVTVSEATEHPLSVPCESSTEPGCYLEHCSEQHLLSTDEHQVLPNVVVGRYDVLLDASSLAWNPSLACPTTYAISDTMGGVHLVDAVKHCKEGSWTCQYLFRARTHPRGSMPQQDVSVAGSSGPLRLLWSADGCQLLCHGKHGTALIQFGQC